MRAPQSELTIKIIEEGEGKKLFKDKFEFEGVTYIVRNAPSYTEIEEKENGEN